MMRSPLFAAVAILIAAVPAACTLTTSEEKQLLLLFKAERSNAHGVAIDTWENSTDMCSWSGVACDESGHVSELSLAYNGIDGSLPQSFGQLAALTSLLLHDNKFTGSLPESWSALVALEFGMLDHNYLTGTIPQGMSNLLSLIQMDLRSNCLSTENSTSTVLDAMYTSPQNHCPSGLEDRPCAAGSETMAADGTAANSPSAAKEDIASSEPSLAPTATMFPATVILSSESTSQAQPRIAGISRPKAVVMFSILSLGCVIFAAMAFIRWGNKLRKLKYVTTLKPDDLPQKEAPTRFSSLSRGSSSGHSDIPARRQGSAEAATFAWAGAQPNLGLPDL